jgi:propionyl-CoA carboxylase alpha chain
VTTTPTRTLRSVLVANRGEIARRVFRTARDLGLRTVAVHSDADAGAPFVREADLAVRLPGVAPAETYLRGDLLVAAALRAGADCVHPGYGFLSEDAAFARAVVDAGLVWVGPDPDSIAAMAGKLDAKRRMAAAGVPTSPSVEVAGLSPGELTAAAEGVGYPLMVKAAFGGGGRGLRVVTDAAGLADAVAGATREAGAAFGDGTVFLERLVTPARHVEVQVFGDRHGNHVALHERECSVQRRNQKVIEEAPSPAVDDALRERLRDAAVRAAAAIGYVGAGTVEFLLGPGGELSFLEVNTRLQVEHPVTEAVTGLDLVRLQFLVAAGEPLPADALRPALRGHAVEARLYAEDPASGWLPQAGRLDTFEVPARAEFGGVGAPADGGPAVAGVRLDGGVVSGDEVGVAYDPMLAKVIAWAPDRAAACRLLDDALSRARLHGVVTNRDLLVRVLRHPAFLAGETDTGFLERHGVDALAAPLAGGPDRAVHAGAARRRAAATVLAGLPSGWRNNPAVPQVLALEPVGGKADPLEVGYRHGRDGATVRVDGEPVPVRLLGTSVTTPEREAEVRLELTAGDGGPLALTARVVAVPAGDDSGDDTAVVHVDSPLGATSFREVPRHPAPQAHLAAGSLTATVPGRVVAVKVQEGDAVTAGQPLLVIEAMKMEHPVTAPAAGVVRRIDVTVGDQTRAGDVLAVVEEPDSGFPAFDDH